MSHNILSLHQQRFDTRVTLGGCIINIDGNSLDCLVDKDNTNRTNPTYTVTDKATRKELCTFRPYHVHGQGRMYQLEGTSQCGGDSTLIVPLHGMLTRIGEDPDEDSEDSF